MFTRLSSDSFADFKGISAKNFDQIFLRVSFAACKCQNLPLKVIAKMAKLSCFAYWQNQGFGIKAVHIRMLIDS